ncbi:DNA alkylation repair protein [Microbacterium sp. GXF7504]
MPAASARDLAALIRRRLRDAGDPARAVGQQAYMKSALPFHGVRVPDARRIAQTAARGHDDTTLVEASRMLWAEATHREEWYAAMALLGRVTPHPSLVSDIEHMVRTGRWWDVTDELAHRLADLHDAFPAETAEVVLRWCVDGDLWIRRIAVLSQLGRRDRVDAGLLAAVIEPNRGDGEFFIRKAIGWALREYARVVPDWVRTYVDTHGLSALTRREALKHLGPNSSETA